MLSDSDRAARLQEQRQQTSTTTTTTTTSRPSPIYVSSTTPFSEYDDDDENREPLPIPPPAPLRMGKTSPAQQARLMLQHDQAGQSGKAEEQKKERQEATRSSSVKGGSKKSKENEIRQEKVDKAEPTTIKSPPPPTTTTTTTTTTTPTPPALERESEPLMIRPSTGHIRGRLSEMPETATTTMAPEMGRGEHSQMLQLERELPQNKISIHQLISQAMPTLQMSVVPVYFMNRATRTVMAVPYLVMKSVSKMPLIPGMVDGLTPPSLPGAQTLLSFASHRIQRNNALRQSSNTVTLQPSVVEQPSAASPVRDTNAGQILESGVEEARDDDSGSPDASSASAAPTTQSESNWVTIDSPAAAETLDNTWFRR